MRFDPQQPDPDWLAHLYSMGFFPMADPDSHQLEWFSPDPRGVLPLDAFHVPDSLRRRVAARPFAIRTDTAFAAVIEACATDRSSDNRSWIDERIVTLYLALHERGQAHSIEAWHDGNLVGGLYGVHLGAAFFGESMFIRPDLGGRDASKICLVHLVHLLRARGFHLLDTQFWNPHLDQFGCIEIPRDDYLEQLDDALQEQASWPDEVPEVR